MSCGVKKTLLQRCYTLLTW